MDKNQIDKIKIAGWQKLSLIDYPGKMAMVIFLAGCNMRCHYCHNHQILDVNQNQIPLGKIIADLKMRRKWLDAVVVSGGEPTIYSNLIPLLRFLRSLGYLVKLDTNGTRPDIVRIVVENDLVDYVALDLKAPACKYVAITGVSMDSVLETARYLKQQKRVPYLFRTTLTPKLCADDLVELGKNIVDGALIWHIQQCRISGAYSGEEIQKMVQKIKPYATHVVVRGL